MKIIHTADLHLDSPLISVKDSAKRRLELVQALNNLSQYAQNNDVSAVIVAGDLFDDKFTTKQTVQSVADVISQSNIPWFVLKGNHGDASPYLLLAEKCNLVKLFDNNWTKYTLGDVVVCGRELGSNDQTQWSNLQLDSGKFNIVVLHGDIDNDAYGFIDKQTLANSNVNYVALGHRHAYLVHKFGNKIACYSGVLECRGFDELEQTGFIVIDTQVGTKFVPQSIRRVVSKTVDISSVTSDVILQQTLMDALSDVDSKHYLNLKIVGVTQLKLSVKMIAEQVCERFFAVRIEDNSSVFVDLQSIVQEVSLRGEFVKLALQIEDKSVQEEVLKLGLSAIKGDNLS